MFQRYYIECPVCKKTTVLRIQAGFLDYHPIRINCGNCKISLNGYAIFEAPKILLKMDSAKIIPETKANFLVASSGELLTPQLKEITNGEEEINMTLSPFMHLVTQIGHEQFTDYKKNILNCIAYIDKKSDAFKIINQLYFLTQESYLKKILQKILPAKMFPLNNKHDIYRAVHQINRMFYECIDKYRADNIAKLMWKEMPCLLKANPRGFTKLCKYFEKQDLINKWEYRIFQLTSQIIDNFDKFIPIIGLKYYNKTIEEIENEYAITTVNFEEIEPIYFKCYELLSDMLPLLVAYNNLKTRNNFEDLKTGIKFRGKPIRTIDDYIKIDSKGFKIDYIDGSEFFDNIVFNAFDRDVRNSIGHFNYEILRQDVFAQTIQFNNLKDSSKNVSKSLLRICFDTWKMFLSINDLSEMLYQTQKIIFLSHGLVITYVPDSDHLVTPHSTPTKF